MKGTLSPIVLFSDFHGNGTAAGGASVIGPTAQTWYYGLEGIGQIGMIKPSFEVIVADGQFGTTAVINIKSKAAFAGVEAAVNKAINPYVAVRYTKGDNEHTEPHAKGFVGITDIGRFTPLMGMDGNILGEHLDCAGAAPTLALVFLRPRPGRRWQFVRRHQRRQLREQPRRANHCDRCQGQPGRLRQEPLLQGPGLLIRYDKMGNLVRGAGKPGAGVP